MIEPTSALRFAAEVGARIIGNVAALEGQTICFTGELPFSISDLWKLLPASTSPARLDNKTSSHLDPTTAMVVVGLEGYDEEGMRRYVQEARSRAVFLPQEGFLDFVLFGYDWWAKQVQLLDRYLPNHGGLAFARSLAQPTTFRWPTTDAAESPGMESGIEYRATTELYEFGYQINGPTVRKRHQVLDKATENFGLEYVARTIASHVRSRKRQLGGLEKYHHAIAEWEADLLLLKRQYNASKHGFQWPQTGA